MAKDETKDTAAIAVLTVGTVAAMIAEAIKGLVTAEQLKDVNAKIDNTVLHLVDKTELAQQIGAALDAAVNYTDRLCGVALTELDETKDAQPLLNTDWLKGLTFSSATQEKKMVEGRPRMVATPIERELQPGDVLGFRVDGNKVHLVAADGKKHTVEI